MSWVDLFSKLSCKPKQDQSCNDGNRLRTNLKECTRCSWAKSKCHSHRCAARWLEHGEQREGERLEMKGDQTQGVKSRGIVGAGGSAVMQTVESLVSELFDMIGCGEAR